MAQMFGTRALPPGEAVPGEVADAIEAWREAQARTGRAKAALGEHRRIGIAQARGKDIEQHAAAIEAGTAPPKSGAHEQRANQKLAQLVREVAAAELVEERCRQKMDERIGEHSSGDRLHRRGAVLKGEARLPRLAVRIGAGHRRTGRGARDQELGR
jgi:hypothetical protein